MTVDDSEMQKLWKLTNELTAQLIFNRNVTLELKQQLADLQVKTSGKAPIVAAGYGYGDYNLADYRLRIANERLREENQQLQDQLREYERWMEYIMGKFRLQNFAMAQSRKESMQEAYKMAEQGGEAAMRLQEENTALHMRISDLGAVARKAIHEEYYTTESLIESLEAENRGLREMLGVAEGRHGAITGRIHFHHEEEDDEVRRVSNRVSFPSTGSTGSWNMASGESDHEMAAAEEPLSPRQLMMRQQLQQQQEQGFLIQAPVPLSVYTGFHSPTTASSFASSVPTSPRSVSSFSSTSTTTPTSPSSGLRSPGLLDSTEQFNSISPPLDDAATGHGDIKQKGHRGKITINTNLGFSKASRTS
ncbi:hypothetical protein BC939DRAFT_473650 [Gamsiella multidivaricata]|uniref:uncharacterized protein n=1 Tax=Gamsiella multidivaricata TaxID=101098 RepID=UPI002220780E|nr:uncharacterized protein BC939DRAFT_473650 [Gamsiella multidivaricata]KAG0359445.1 hypothetical protein BGZ54_009961 [Gamsiella multidivaricata]KAI7830426.1 hypothetical protein BC939DRAFT_473650 [Gamsiella multidivaricata]